ncbi:unnamed protein product [Periconia digitata]|uniref:Uncharacterized protein n=1 Tax=Periconia digitata TaxID=1303443 RepID=A0A9W4UJH0_9PLEO|nr:unnamed protein product [Periconia digitata]
MRVHRSCPTDKIRPSMTTHYLCKKTNRQTPRCLLVTMSLRKMVGDAGARTISTNAVFIPFLGCYAEIVTNTNVMSRQEGEKNVAFFLISQQTASQLHLFVHPRFLDTHSTRCVSGSAGIGRARSISSGQRPM